MLKTSNKTLMRAVPLVVLVLLTGVLSVNIVVAQIDTPPEEPPIPGVDGVLIGADYWADEPMILSAGLGFEGIIGID